MAVGECRVEREAKLKLFDQTGYVSMTTNGVALGVEDAGEVVAGEDAFVVGFEGFVAEDGVDAGGYPAE